MQLEIGDAEEVHAALCYAYNTITSRVAWSERRDIRRATLGRLVEEIEKSLTKDQVVEESPEDWKPVPDFHGYQMNRAGRIKWMYNDEILIPKKFHPRAWPMVDLIRNGEIHTVVVQRIRGFEWPIVQEV